MMQLRPGLVGLTKAWLRVGCVCAITPRPRQLSPAVLRGSLVNTAFSFESRATPHSPGCSPTAVASTVAALRRPAPISCFIPRHNSMAIMTPTYKPARAVGLTLLCLAATTNAHEHHMDDIADGEYASSDPIVCRRARGPGIAC